MARPPYRKSKRFLYVKRSLWGALLFFTAATASAQITGYNPYEAVFPSDSKAPSLKEKAFTHLLVLPLELVRIPVTKALIWVERYRLPDKGSWFYKKAVENGVTPLLDGLELDFVRMIRLKKHLPDVTAQTWMRYWSGHYFMTGGKLGVSALGDVPLRIFSVLDYQKRPEEYFYGLGSDSSRADSTSYKYESTSFEGSLGYGKSPVVALDMFAGYQKISISNGGNGGKGKIEPIFGDRYAIPGRFGDEIFSTGVRLTRDTHIKNQGSIMKASWSFHEGVDDSRARYFKLKGEWTHFLKLGSERRVFVSRILGEHNNEVNGHEVPFHQMAKLGGFGVETENSETLRSYDRGRFYGHAAALLNLEYRYTVYEYRDWKLDTVLFFDEGQVFNRPSKFQFSDFRESYGGGFNLGVLDKTILSMQVAHGDEGTNFYVKTRAPF